MVDLDTQFGGLELARFSTAPPAYPTAVRITPGTCRNLASTPQKQPAPNVAVVIVSSPDMPKA